MYLKELKLRNFRCFETLDINFHKQLTVLVGSNGSGKTAVMEGASIALGTLFVPMDGISGRRIDKTDAHLKSFLLGSVKDVQPQYPVEVEATGIIGEKQGVWKRCLYGQNKNTTIKDAKFLTDISSSYQERLRNGDPTLILPIIAYYGTNRLWDYHREKRTDTFDVSTRTNGYIDCLDGAANIKLMMNWFKKMTIQKYQRQETNRGSIPELDTVYHAMEKCFSLITGYENVKIQYNLDTNTLDLYYSDSNGLWMQIPVNQLSDGYKGTISLVADIAYRMAVLNPQLLDQVLIETDGIVLIDEIDLHLHPAWQQRVIDDLVSIFPKVQFIVSTHAPAVINSVKSENLIILKDNMAYTTNNEVYGKDVKSILNEIMGVRERPPKVAALFDLFYEQLQSKKYDEASHTLDEIDSIRNYHDPEVAGCRVKLKLERMRNN